MIARLIKAVAIAVAVSMLLWGLLNAGGVRARPAFCVGVALVLAIGWVLLSELARSSAILASPAAPEQLGAEPRPYQDLYFLEYRLSWGSVERARYEGRVRPVLVRVLDERLRQRHGVEWQREPDQAQQIVGEQLWALMTGPAQMDAKPPTHQEITRLVSAIEAI